MCLLSGHFRRYAPRQLADVLGESGFRLRFLTQFMGPLVPLMWLRRCAKAGQRSTSGNRATVDRRWVLEELKVMPFLNELLAAIHDDRTPAHSLGSAAAAGHFAAGHCEPGMIVDGFRPRRVDVDCVREGIAIPLCSLSMIGSAA